MGKIVSFINNKGGVGKTSLSVNLSHCLSNKNKKILYIDNDPQCNGTSILIDQNVINHSLYDIYSSNKVTVEECIYPTSYKNLFILPNVEETSVLEIGFSQQGEKGYSRLSNRIKKYVLENFDYTIIDNCPSWGFFVYSSLFISQGIIIPMLSGSKFSVDGLKKTIKMIMEVKNSIPGNPELELLRILINNVDKRTKIGKLLTLQLQKSFGEDKLFRTSIPTSTDIQQSELYGKTLLRHKPNCIGSQKFRDLCNEFLKIEF